MLTDRLYFTLMGYSMITKCLACSQLDSLLLIVDLCVCVCTGQTVELLYLILPSPAWDRVYPLHTHAKMTCWPLQGILFCIKTEIVQLSCYNALSDFHICVEIIFHSMSTDIMSKWCQLKSATAAELCVICWACWDLVPPGQACLCLLGSTEHMVSTTSQKKKERKPELLLQFVEMLSYCMVNPC